MSTIAYTILIVDDDADARLVMRAALRKAGYGVRVASGGHEALAQFRAQPSDMVMLDVEMPDLDGHAVCTTLRAEFGPLLPIVMVTGMDDVDSVEHAYRCGATDFLAKPVNWALLGHRVRYLLRAHEALVNLRAAEARNAAVLNAIPDLLFELDAAGRYLDYRAPRAELLTAAPDRLLGRTVHEVLPPEAAETCMAAMRTAREQGFCAGQVIELEVAGGRRWFELSVSVKRDEPSTEPHYIVLSRDITERMEAQARIERMAFFDSLTGLPNRRAFLERVDRELHRAEAKGRRAAVLFMDLDGFKNINDTMGHSAGDLVLQWAADRLRDGLRPGDIVSRAMALEPLPADASFELARLGGDEFTALILDIDEPAQALSVAQRIGQVMRRPFALEGREATLTTSIGIAIYPEDGRDAATLLKHADTAMYHAKAKGRDNAQVYCSSLTDEVVQRMELDASLRTALARGEFRLVYQPLVDAVAGCMHGVEALIRWQHPERGETAPLRFIPIAEENGLIEAIGDWVLRRACADAAAWQAEGMDFGVSVNLSPLQFADRELSRRVLAIVAEAGIEPARLELEVTESALMEHSEVTQATLHDLRAAGVRIALDDFGTGYSSLAYLTRMPIGNIKVDRCFIGRLLDGGESAAIVRAVLAMASSLGMRVTAEGVESIEQAQALRLMGCDSLQGYLFSRPVPREQVAALASRIWTLQPESAARSRPLPLRSVVDA